MAKICPMVAVKRSYRSSPTDFSVAVYGCPHSCPQAKVAGLGRRYGAHRKAQRRCVGGMDGSDAMPVAIEVASRGVEQVRGPHHT